MEGDYIPLVTDDFRLTFCRATNALCPDVQRIIWKKVLYEDIIHTVPAAPKKWKGSPVYSRTCSISLPRNLFSNQNHSHSI